MKVGDIVRVRLPHDESGGIPCLLIKCSFAGAKSKWAGFGKPEDTWWEVIYNGELKEVHQDYVREVVSDLHNR